MDQLRIALISTYPPSTGPLSEYAWHLVESLRRNPRVQTLWVLSDRARGSHAHVDGSLHVQPCWDFGSAAFPWSILRAAGRLDVDVLWFNLHMTSTGNSRRSWFAGVSAPAIARAAGFRVLVTLHNMLGLTHLGRAGFDARPWDIGAAHLATGLLCRAQAVCVLRAEYAEILRERYKARDVFCMPHGTLGRPLAAATGRNGAELLAFGHFGTYKRLEPLIDTIGELNRHGYALRLLVGGTDSRHVPGYLAQLRNQYAGRADVEFLGYVAEDDVPMLFSRAALSILPYATMTGMSGVAIQSAMYGVPIIASDIPGFRALERDGMSLQFFDWPDTNSLQRAIVTALASPRDVEYGCQRNLAYVQRQPMDKVADSYLDVVEWLVSKSHLRANRTQASVGTEMSLPISRSES